MALRRGVKDFGSHAEGCECTQIPVAVTEGIVDAAYEIWQAITDVFANVVVVVVRLVAFQVEVNWQTGFRVYVAVFNEEERADRPAHDDPGVICAAAHCIWRVVSDVHQLIVVACHIQVGSPLEFANEVARLDGELHTAVQDGADIVPEVGETGAGRRAHIHQYVGRVFVVER